VHEFEPKTNDLHFTQIIVESAAKKKMPNPVQIESMAYQDSYLVCMHGSCPVHVEKQVCCVEGEGQDEVDHTHD